MGKTKAMVDKLSGTEESSRTVGDALSKLGESVAAEEITTDKLTIGETELDETKLIALLALLN